MLSTSQLFHILLIKFLTENCKHLKLSKIISIEILCYLSDSIDLFSCRNFDSIHDFERKFLCQWSEDTIDCIKTQLYPLFRHYIGSIDNFLDIRYILSNIFDEDSKTDYNSMAGPCCLTKDSSLGIFMRYFLSEWDTLSFEKICDLYDNFTSFVENSNMMNKSMGSMEIDQEIKSCPVVSVNTLPHLLGTSDKILYLHPDYNLDESSKMKFYIEKAIAFNDITTAETLIHQYYDYNGPSTFDSLPFPISPNSTATYHTDRKINHLLSLVKLSSEEYDYNSRHQNALLSLSMLWMKNNSEILAMNSLEEGLKIAHQKDDHIAVAKALLLLYQQNQSEELLIRCLDRSVVLNQRYLVCQASILLAQHRAFRPLRNDYHLDNSSDSHENGHGNDIFAVIPSKKLSSLLKHTKDPQLWDIRNFSTQNSHSSQTTWLLLKSALFGDMKLSSIIAKHKNIGALEQDIFSYASISSSSSSSSSSNSQSNQSNQQNKDKDKEKDKDKISSDTSLSINEYNETVIQIKLVSIKLWIRYGMFDMAIYEYQRILNSMYTPFVPNEDLVRISCDLVITIMDKVDYRFIVYNNYHLDLSEVSTDLQSSYRISIDILALLRKTFPASIPSIFERIINFTSNYVHAIYSFYKNVDVRIMIRYVENCLDISSKSIDGMDKNFNELHFKSMILYGKIYEKNDILSAISIYDTINILCSKDEKMIYYKYYAMIMKANCLVMYTFALQEEAIVLYSDALKASRLFGMPMLESLVCVKGLIFLLSSSS